MKLKEQVARAICAEQLNDPDDNFHHYQNEAQASMNVIADDIDEHAELCVEGVIKKVLKKYAKQLRVSDE